MSSLTYALRLPLRSIAIVTALALLAWSIGLPAWINTAQADALELISDTISDSDLGATAAHRIQFDTPNGLVAGETMVITFDPIGSADFDFTGFTTADIDIVQGATLVGACGGGTDEMTVANGPGEAFTFTTCNDVGEEIASSTTFIVDIGTTTGGNLITNPSTADSYVIRIAGTMQDNGDTRVAIIDDVTVTAAVDTIFNFTINGVDADVTVNDDTQITTGTSTATSVPFGTIQPGNEYQVAQRLTVDTNALNGFSVSVYADNTLTAGNGATIDEFIDGSPDVASTTAWQGPAGTFGSTDTYGHWGLTSDDDALSVGPTESYGSGVAWYRGDFMDPSTPVEVFYHGTAVTQNAGIGVGSTTVAYKVEITSLQEAAKDYTATLTYIATPVF